MARAALKVATLRHKGAKRRNIPTAEPVMQDKNKPPIWLAYEQQNRDLDPQLVWRGNDEQGWSDLIVQAPAALYSGEGVPEGADRGPAAPE